MAVDGHEVVGAEPVGEGVEPLGEPSIDGAPCESVGRDRVQIRTSLTAYSDIQSGLGVIARDVVDHTIASLVSEIILLRRAAVLMLRTECQHGRSCSDPTHQKLWAAIGG